MASLESEGVTPTKRVTLDSDFYLIKDYLKSLSVERNVAKNTLAAYQQDLVHFKAWLQELQLSLLDVDSGVLTRYLFWRMTENYKSSSTARVVSSLKGFYQQLLILQKIQLDPCFGVKSAKPNRPEKSVLSMQEVDELLSTPDTQTDIGLRDKAMLEMLYATGVNISELINLRIKQVNLKTGVVIVGSDGQNQRVVPMTNEALFWLIKYLKSARKKLA